MGFYRKGIKIWLHYCSEGLQGNATSAEVQCWAGKRGKKKDLVSRGGVVWGGGNGPSQTVSPPATTGAEYITRNKMKSDMIRRDIRWHAERMENFSKRILMSPTYGHTEAYCTQKSIFNRQFCWFYSPWLPFPPLWHVCLSSSATYSPKISTKRDTHRQNRPWTIKEGTYLW